VPIAIPHGPPFQHRLGTPESADFPASDSDKGAQKLVFRSLDEHFALCDLDALGEGRR